MLTKDDIESFLVRLAATGATYSEVEPGFWIVRPSAESDLSIAVNYSPPVVLLRIDVMGEIGASMDVRYRETAGGGLAATPTGRRLARERLVQIKKR